MGDDPQRSWSLSQMVVAAVAAGLLLSTWVGTTVIVVWIVVAT